MRIDIHDCPGNAPTATSSDCKGETVAQRKPFRVLHVHTHRSVFRLFAIHVDGHGIIDRTTCYRVHAVLDDFGIGFDCSPSGRTEVVPCRQVIIIGTGRAQLFGLECFLSGAVDDNHTGFDAFRFICCLVSCQGIDSRLKNIVSV